jgi:ankyrin repeat protein
MHPELPKDHPVFDAARKGCVEELKHLLSSGVSPHSIQKEGISLFALALRGGNAPCVAALIEAGIPPNEPINRFGETPLFVSISGKAAPLFDLLIDKGASPIKANTFGYQPLHIAAAGGFLHATSRLLELGADINIKTIQKGGTPLIEAARNGQVETIEFLLRKGALIELQNKDGETALVLAAKAGKAGAVNMLLKAGANQGHKDMGGKTALDWAVANSRAECVASLSAGQ